MATATMINSGMCDTLKLANSGPSCMGDFAGGHELTKVKAMDESK